METIDFTGVVAKKLRTRVMDMPEGQRSILLAAKQLETAGEPVTAKELARIREGNADPDATRRANSIIANLREKGCWPYHKNGTNGVVTSRQLIWPDTPAVAVLPADPVPPPPPAVAIPSAVPVPPPPSPDRAFALSVLRQFLELSEVMQDRSWPHVRGLIDAALDPPIEPF
jgi:hypothetical protein